MKAPSLALLFILICMGSGFAAEAPAAEVPAEDSNPMEELSRSLIKQTGTAISPVIGLSYLALNGDPSVEQYKPWIWGVLVLLALVLVKDVAGTFVPGILKKPLDAVEFFQNQGLGALCAALLVPDLHSKLYAVVESQVPLTQWASSGGGGFFLAAAGSEGILHILTLPLSIVTFAAVWLLSNTINALVMLSPFSLVDACLKSIKVFGLALLAGLSAIHPYAGAVLSILIVLVALYLSGKAFRLYHFGWVFAWDLLTRKHKRYQVSPDYLMAFLDQELAEVPARTYGKLSRDSDTGLFHFSYRPWLVLPAKTVGMSLGNQPKVGLGVIHATIESTETDGDLNTYFHFTPCYRGHEEAISQYLGIESVEIGVRRGFKMALQWVRSAFRKKALLQSV